MKKTLIAIGMVMLMAAFGFAADRDVTVAWDPYTGDDAPTVDRIEIYQRVLPSGTYDYDAPVAGEDQTVDADGNSTPSTVTYTATVPDGVKTDYEIVARGINEHGPSVDSDPVVWTADQTPLAAVDDLSGTFDKQTNEITFTWTQTSVDRVNSWKLFQSTASGGPWTEVDEIINDGTSADFSSTQPVTPPAAGETVTYYFTVVAFAGGGISSPNSNEVAVTIDRRPAKKVINLRVTVK